MTITLITSASYVADELAAEFGRLPTAFLPVGHNRLYDLQVGILGPGVHLTLPESFDLPAADGARLAGLGVTVLRVPDGLSLGNSVLYALEVIGETPVVRILHGDTVIHDLPEGGDVLAMGDAPEAYHWGKVPEDTNEPDTAAPTEVLAGYFAFADGVEFRRCLAVSRGDFVGGINRYDRTRELRRHKVTSWLDCGHLQTYYRSRCSMRIQRSFNDLSISYSVVEKRSSDTVKLAGEAAWFEAIPTALRLYTPAFLGRLPADGGREAGYAIEYLPSPSLHELFVFGAVGAGVWSKVIEGSFAFMRAARDAGRALGGVVDTSVIRQVTIDKTEARLEKYCAEAGISTTQEWRYRGRACPSLIEIARQTAGLIDMDSRRTLGIMHGDLCFTNMFYDFRTQRIKVIDPRGTIDGAVHTVLGDVRYDMAKLNHSIVGAYDFILAGRYACEGFAARDMGIEFPRDSSFDRVNALAGEFDLDGLRLTDPEITAITIHLFLSMLPLHADRPERQRAFVANALRLFAERIPA